MFRFLPWKFIVQRVSRAYGITDPALWLARLRNFAQPSEVAEPIELLRAGILFHARGVVNTKAIQHNLDWVWPYWVERQFDPEDVSFIPRAFSISHVNLTHRNWTAIGLPRLSIYPIVDPRGLLTPAQDGWSLDFWLLDAAGKPLLPSRLPDDAIRQELSFAGDLSVVTTANHNDCRLRQSASVVLENNEPAIAVRLEASSPRGGALVVALRPYNPEGVQFIDRIAALDANHGWRVNDRLEIHFDRPADQLLASDYSHGDVLSLLSESPNPRAGADDSGNVHCKVGMATAAALFRFPADQTAVELKIPLQKEVAVLGNEKTFDSSVTWSSIRSQIATLRIPDDHYKFLYDAAVHTLVLLSADEIVPGPYTYRRFWFRDACLMMNALLSIGLADRCRRALEQFPSKQLANGYFRSQEGEWDSNGQVLWAFDRYEILTGERLPDSLLPSVAKAITWIDKKRVRDDSDPLHWGLLPAGFSAEHLGPNDFYYWDDFWSEAGLRSAANLYARRGQSREAHAARAKADDLRASIDRSLSRIPTWRSLAGIPPLPIAASMPAPSAPSSPITRSTSIRPPPHKSWPRLKL